VSKTPTTDTNNDRRLAGCLLFLLSMATLTLEIIQVRVFSYCINPIFVYMVISLALLGIGTSGTVLALLPGLRRIPIPRALAGCLVLFAGSAAVANFAFARLSHLVVASSGMTLLSPVALIFVLFTVPYFFSGLAVALVLISDSDRVARNYFVNLVGSGAGCFIAYPFLASLGAERLILLVLLSCAFAGTLACLRWARAWVPAAALVTAALLLGVLFARQVLPFQPDHSDFLALAIDRLETQSGSAIEPERVFERWDPVGKIEIFQFPEPYGQFAGDVPSLLFTQDAGAPSLLLGLGDRPEMRRALARSTIYGLAPSLRPSGRVLVMGLGGGPDLLASLAAGTSHVTGVEINAAVIQALGTQFRDYLGLPSPGSDRLALVHADGRAFARRFTSHFDVIQMTGADTYAAGAISGSVLSENYLYTIEAFRDFFRALKPDGVLAVTRFGLEPLKIVTTGIVALQSAGIRDVGDHLVMVRQGPLWMLTLIKKTPFTPEELDRIRDFCAMSSPRALDFSIPVYDVMGFRLDRAIEPMYLPTGTEPQPPRQNWPQVDSFLAAAKAGHLEQRLSELQKFDLTPSTDDRPFFLQLERLRWPSLSELFARSDLSNPLAWNMTRYVAIVFQIGLIALLLILGPLFAFRRRGLALAATAPLAGYFFAIGAGFMFVEIGLMQRFTLFLGHPIYSISTVLFCLLFFSGIGSYASGRWSIGARATVGIAAGSVVLGVLALGMLSGPIFERCLDFEIGVRIGLSVLMLAPLSFFMGIPLPTLLQLTEERTPDFAPWALGVNGFASVLGSLATIPLTIALGFATTFSLGALAYAVAWVTFEAFRWSLQSTTVETS
jgi:SAM-dependent methyltransferase